MRQEADDPAPSLASSAAAGSTGWRQPAPARVADAVARVLAAHGVRHAFGMPGGEVVTLVDGLEAAGIRFVLARHETSAAIMAAAASLMSGAPGLLVTTLGPGLANAVNGIADAQQERVPLIVLSGVVERSIRARYTHQILDHAALLRPLVKASFEIEAEGAAATMARAIALALTPPFGPVHLDLSPAVAAKRDAGPPARATPTIVSHPAPDVGDPALAEVRRRLAAARRPLILAGFEAARDGASAALTRLAEAHRIPVITTYKGKGVVDEHLPAALGAAGLSPAADRILLDIAGRADVVILAGYDPIEMRAGWLDPFDTAAEVVELTGLPPDHAMHDASRRIVGRVAPLLDALLAGLAPGKPWPDGEPAAARRALRHLFAPPQGSGPQGSGPQHWGPHAVFATLAQALPGGTIVTVDSGAHRILLSQQWQARRPLHLLQSTGFCTMNCAVPLALGASISSPGRPVVAVVGDGGLEMGAGELASLRDQGLPVIVVVLQDESLALIELKQAQAGLARHGVRLGPTRFALLAQAFGGHGVEVASSGELTAALAEALARDTFSLIACRIEANAYVDRI